jgi:alkanesulfonate monooxygenase SsuD/methylene tetrahydromethanopterin reductase-like flavin-dependent oxidoreductase (luciferase family)
MGDSVQQSVKFGVSLPNRAVLFGWPFETLLQTAEQAESSGMFDSIWVGDNFLSKPRLEAVVALSALAARTRRLKLGTVCLATFPLRHPLQFAIQWASLDIASGGRTRLVVCNGGSARQGEAFAAELAAMGVRSNERVGRVEEGIELLRRFFSRGPVTHHGRFYHFDDVELEVKPVQERVPIDIAVNPPKDADPALEERVLRRVARLADGWQTDAIEPAVFRRRWTQIQEYAAEYGREGEVTDAQLHLMVNINDDANQAYNEARGFLDRYYGDRYYDQGSISGSVLENWLASGPPSAVAEKINSYVAAGYTTIILRFTSPQQLEQLERCVTDVLPNFGCGDR